MKDLTLYYPDGCRTLASTVDFVGFYSQAYYYRAGNTALEQEMGRLLAADSLTGDDIADILGWKTGGRLDQSTGVITYGYGATIQVGEVAQAISGKKAPHMADPAATLCCLCNKDGIGFTIAMALKCFLSDGNMPIYDRFAHLAFAAIRDGKRPGEIIAESGLVLSPTIKVEADAHKTLKHYQEEFASYLTGCGQEGPLLGVPYSRDVDRTLWAYGHLFNDTKLNGRRISPKTIEVSKNLRVFNTGISDIATTGNI